ncbi:MAG: PDZ domain-containing protein, partial [Saprospiraceae bacterium]
ANNSSGSSLVQGNELESPLGFELRNLSREEGRSMQMQGAIVSSVRRGSVVAETHMQPGLVITTVNGGRVSNLAEAIDAIKNASQNLVLDGYYEGQPDLYSYRFRKPD